MTSTSQSSPGNSNTITAVLWMFATLMSFVVMGIAVRELSFTMGTFEIHFFRSFVGLLILLPLIAANPMPILRPGRLDLHFMRNLVHFGATQLWIVGITVLPLAMVFAIEFTTPIWGTLLAAIFLSERLTKPRLVALIGGFIGILIVVRPGFGVFHIASLLVLASAFGYGITVITTKYLSATTSGLGIVFWMSIIQMPLALVMAVSSWVQPGLAHLPALIALGITGLSAHYCMVRALKLADASFIMPFDFARLPIVAVFGYFLYSEALDPWVFAGAVLIFSVNYYALRREQG